MFFARKSYYEHFIKKAKKFNPFEVKAYDDFFVKITENVQPVIQKEFGLNLLLISDTHCELAFNKSKFFEFVEENQNYDICVLLGDIHPKEIEIILEVIPSQRIIAVTGNHDLFDQYNSKGIREITSSTFTYKGVKFGGMGGSFKYKSEKFPSYTQYESLNIANNMISRDCDIDVLFTHDSMFTSSEGNFAHLGLIGITYLIYKSNIKWHFHGHIHKSYLKKLSNGTYEKSVYSYEIVNI